LSLLRNTISIAVAWAAVSCGALQFAAAADTRKAESKKPEAKAADAKPAEATKAPAPKAPLPPPDAAQVDFARDIEPIFKQSCFQCHGTGEISGGLKLGHRSNILSGGDSGEPAAVVGHSDQSKLVNLIARIDPDQVMPPKGDPLSTKQIGLVRAWIDQGLKMPEEKAEQVTLWSFQPVKKVDPPRLADPWAAQPIDAFVLEKLRANNLNPTPPADRVQLIRRVYLDTLGLPPSPEEIDRFVHSRDPKAYERLVDEVLASPHYGERWARHWLDVIRFADTDGYENNAERRNSYPFRDYLIRAFNQDRPLDRMIVEQLAGDAVGEDAATAFIVGGAVDRVGSPDIVLTRTQRQDELADMVGTTGTAFLGLTVGCAKCHDHKFDPISQRDYYCMQAVFAGVEHQERPLKYIDGGETEAAKAFAADPGKRPAVSPIKNEENFPATLARSVRFTIRATNDGSEPCIDELEIYEAPDAISDMKASPDKTAGDGPAKSSERKNSNKDAKAFGEGNSKGSAGSSAKTTFVATTANTPIAGGATPEKLVTAKETKARKGKGKTPARNVALASAGAKVSSSGNFSGSEKHKLDHVNDGKFGNDNSWISNEAGRGWVQIDFPSEVSIDRIVWGRDRRRNFSDRLATDYVIEVATQPGKWRKVASGDDRRSLAAKLPMVYAGSFVQPGPSYRLNRGDPMQPKEQVVAEAISSLVSRLGSLGLKADSPEQQRRLALAHWIARPDNPLTPRVAVNRLWQHHFGAGIVASPSDFGRMGTPPTHPELLDWLAGELVRNGWHLKAIHRLILLSNTYQQADVPNPQGLATDATCRWLWRFPTHRLEAEAIRDSVLMASGAIDLTMYGHGFSVFEPNNNYVRVYNPRTTWGPAEWRRMVYMIKIRREPDGVFGAFDQPDAGQVCPKRSRSTTAIQALNMLNSSFMVQQSKMLAERVEREVGKKTPDCIRRAFLLTVGRAPEPDELAAGERLATDHGITSVCRALFNSNEFLFLP
jgi:mono/diheme cytochrome c family protein